MMPMGITTTARQQAREHVIAEIITVSRRQLAAEGAASLSLRAVARELDMASSAIYRYVKSRDELLTMLIVNAYNALGEAAENASVTKGTVAANWRSMCHAIRTWAIEHPHEYALLFGSPVPGYVAPASTVDPASRVTLILARLLDEAYRAGDIAATHGAVLQEDLASELHELVNAVIPDVPAEIVARGLAAWTLVLGHVSFEVFGRFDDMVVSSNAFFDNVVTLSMEVMGLEAPRS